MQSKTSSINLRLLVILLFVLLFVLFMYTFLHELGHAILGGIFGQSLTEFNVSFWDFSAHVGMNGELTQSQLAIQAIAGVSLPLLVWAIFMGLAPRKAGFILEVLKLCSSLGVLNTLLAWVVIPVLYLLGRAPSSDDVTHFLQASQMHPLLLMFVALVLYVRGWAFFLSKTEGLRSEFILFRTVEREALTASARAIISIMTGTMALAAACAFLLNYLGVQTSPNQMYPPPEYAVVAEVDLSKQTYVAETLAEFTVKEYAPVGVFIAVRDIDTTYFDLSVVGPEEYSSVVMHGEEYRANRDGGLWEENLLPGTYHVVLTSNQSPGTAAIFLKTH